MNDLLSRLRDADPLPLEPELPAETRDAMRRAIVEAAGVTSPARARWGQPFALAAMATLAAAGAVTAHRFADDRDRLPAAPHIMPSSVTTQVDFRTPGGTRIIWTIDPAFNLGGVHP